MLLEFANARIVRTGMRHLLKDRLIEVSMLLLEFVKVRLQRHEWSPLRRVPTS
ncbi:hypothetical protein N177_3196 [Lutibaculum baratangense AMV1]|uniref:Uncharacterized protein n=1 Tax=Lutibaculum baratangense AMV1 TaxID=631454 RepID=V4T9C2_9HYPH|nr:hypothetical protein N177_3196 [Lutibaculum baratangense AMV1]